MTAKIYTDAEVDDLVAQILSRLPDGSHVTSRIENAAKSVHLTVTVPPDKRETFEHGVINVGKWKSRPRPGPPFDERAVEAIVRWSRK